MRASDRAWPWTGGQRACWTCRGTTAIGAGRRSCRTPGSPPTTPFSCCGISVWTRRTIGCDERSARCATAARGARSSAIRRSSKGRSSPASTGECSRSAHISARPAIGSSTGYFGSNWRRRLELRRPAQPAIVLPHDDLRARRTAGIRGGKGGKTRCHRRAPSRAGVPPRAATMSIAIDWSDHPPGSKDGSARGVGPVLVPHAMALRHPVGARLPAPGRRRARWTDGRGRRSRATEAPRGRALAPRKPASGTGPFRDGRPRRIGEPLEHPSSAPRAPLGRRGLSDSTISASGSTRPCRRRARRSRSCRQRARPLSAS